MLLVLELKHTVEEGFVLYRNIYRKIKKQKSQKLGCISIKLNPVCLPLLLPLPYKAGSLAVLRIEWAVSCF